MVKVQNIASRMYNYTLHKYFVSSHSNLYSVLSATQMIPDTLPQVYVKYRIHLYITPNCIIIFIHLKVL